MFDSNVKLWYNHIIATATILTKECDDLMPQAAAGKNDFSKGAVWKNILSLSIPLTVARGAEALVRKIRATLLPPEPQPQILLVSPIRIGDVSVNPVFGPLFGFERASAYSAQLAPYYRDIAGRRGCAFLDAASVASPSPVDGLHMEPEEHAKLAAALADKVRELLG